MRKNTSIGGYRGYTLMELVIGFAIVGILAAVAVPFYRDYMIRAEVMGAFEYAESMRVQVMVDDNDDLIKGNGILYEAKNTSDTVQLLYWTRGKAGSGLKGRMTAGLNLPRISDAFLPSFDLEWRENGDWHCVPAKPGKPGQVVLDPKYLPGACRDSGPMSAPKASASTKLPTPPSAPPAAPSCPADQEMITLSTGPACTPKCPAGQERDKANPTQCKAIVCGPNEELSYERTRCMIIPPRPTCGPGSDAFRAYTASNEPTWSCLNACPPGQMPGKAFKCIPDPNYKAPVTPPAAAVTPPAKPAAPTTRPGEDKVASVKCRTCTPGLEDLCEQVHEEITCTAPNNWCATFVDNHADGTKTVSRGCANFERVYTEWFQGTSDDDKCRERINSEQHIDFTCTFGCGSDNCNDNLRPAEDSLYAPK